MEILINNGAFVVSTATASEVMISKEGAVDVTYTEDGTLVDPTMGTAEVKDPLLSSWPFVIGISVSVLFVSVVCGVLLAKLKIKKGIDLYED